MAFLIPTGLHAKQLVDFCLMDRIDVEMAADHSCCEKETEKNSADKNSHDHHDCDWGFICACNISQSALSDKQWIPVTQNHDGLLTEKENLTPFTTSEERINSDLNKRIGEHDPPLWLLYDTFLN